MHPFYSPVKGWTSAVDLRAGDILVMLNGEYVVVEQVQHELLESPETTYNFEVEDLHTYHVSENEVLLLCDPQKAIVLLLGQLFVGTGKNLLLYFQAFYPQVIPFRKAEKTIERGQRGIDARGRVMLAQV